MEQPSESLPARLEDMIVAGSFSPGDRLPSERRLAADLGVSRSSLREAIKQLDSRGLLVSQRGGGTYVTSPAQAEPVRTALLPLAPLAQSESGYWRDVMEIRKSLEGDVASFAAMRANMEDKARIAAAYDALSTALRADDAGQDHGDTPSAAGHLDAGFHMAVARATHNVVLHQVMTGLEGLLETTMSDSMVRLYRLPGVALELDAQHRRIMETILAGSPDEARQAAEDHLLFIERRLEDIERDAARQSRSSRAFQQIRPMEDAL